MTGVEWVKAAVLGVLLAIAVICVLLWVLSRLGLLDHDGWITRDRRRPPQRFTAAELAAVRARQRATERWLDAHHPDRRAPTYRPVPLHELVARANRLPSLCLSAHVPVSPDPRRKES